MEIAVSSPQIGPQIRDAVDGLGRRAEPADEKLVRENAENPATLRLWPVSAEGSGIRGFAKRIGGDPGFSGIRKVSRNQRELREEPHVPSQ